MTSDREPTTGNRRLNSVPRTVTVIINPIAGGGTPARAARRAELAARVVSAAGVVPEVFVTEHAGHARELAAAAVRRGAARVCAWGGDGTLNEVASALASTGVALGIIPAGSGNGLARELGIPLQAERALAAALALEPRPIDLGEIDGRPFINIAGIGLDAWVAARFNAPLNRRRGLLGYLRLGTDALLRYAPVAYTIDTPAGRRVTRALLVAIANSAQWGNNARIAPGAEVDDGRLDLVVVAERSPLSMAWHVPRLFTGTIGRMAGCTLERLERLTIEADAPIPYHLDGEPVEGGRRLEVRVRPGAIRVAAGRSTRRGPRRPG